MKPTALLIASFLLIGITAHAAKIKGNGNVVTKEIQVSDFDKIKVGGNFSSASNLFNSNNSDKEGHKLFYSQAKGKSKLSVTIDENLLPLLLIESKDGQLVIRTKNKDNLIPTKFILRASSEKITKMSVSGSMDLITETTLQSELLDISVSGAGDVILKKRANINSFFATVSGAGDVKITDLQAKVFEGKVSGAGDISVKGKAEKANFKVSGKGDVSAYEFIADNVIASVSGAGDIEVYAQKTLKASASGAGDITYKGNPEVESSTSGAGSIKKKSL